MECAGPKLDILSPAQGTQWKREGKECKSQRSERSSVAHCLLNTMKPLPSALVNSYSYRYL